jgi:uncharacterized membrane protein YgcG
MKRLIACLILVVLAVATRMPGGSETAGAQDEGWVIRAFDVRYELQTDGSFRATEDIAVDFGALERHGIFRDMPVEYRYDDSNNRLIEVSDVSVTDGRNEVPFETSDSRPNMRIKIGDPDKLVTGPQRYVISYTVHDGLNPFPDHDELFWNVTGDDWPVPIERASATVVVPDPGVERITCFQGPRGLTAPCASSLDATSPSFRATEAMDAGSGLTIVVGLRKGLVAVGPPSLVPANEDVFDTIGNYFAVKWWTLALAILATIVVLTAMARLWWVAGRDRWFGNMYYIREDPPEETKPLLARETFVVEYQPPDVRRGRRLRPAEIGLLMDERADTLDVSATIVDLAVRGHLQIKEMPKGGIFGAFKSQDYELVRQDGETLGSRSSDGLLPYESRLKDALFNGEPSVKLSDLKNKFHEDLAQVKSDLYEGTVSDLNLFPQNPDRVRTVYRVAGAVIAGVGAAIAYFFGSWFGAGLIGIPLAVAGLILFLLAHLMPRRTASGRVLYRRCLGFRLYMTMAEKERQAFAERANLFEEYLPYAIVYGCVKKWAKAFEGLGLEKRASDWYVGSRAFAATQFAESVGDFSSSISGVMASTPGGSGGSGFGGGGGSGGGGGGGGGGSW